MRNFMIGLLAAAASLLLASAVVAEQTSETQNGTSKTFNDGSSNTCSTDSGKCSCTGQHNSEACKDLKSGACFQPSGDGPNSDGSTPGSTSMSCDSGGCECSMPKSNSSHPVAPSYNMGVGEASRLSRTPGFTGPVLPSDSFMILEQRETRTKRARSRPLR